MNIDELATWLKEHRVTEVSCLVPDFNGTARGKSMAPSLFLDGYRNNSLRLPEATYAVNAHGEFIFNEHIRPEERDIVLMCDLSSLHFAPWTKDQTVGIICDAMTLDGDVFNLAPRQVLKNVIELYNRRGWTPIVGPEVEFYLISKFEGNITEPQAPRGAGGLREYGQFVYSLDGIDEFDPFFEDLYDFAELQGLQIDSLIHEDGPCQFEINLRHTDALRVADQLFLFKRLARQVAKRHGFFVTFMAKPYAQESGSSIHMHQSVVETDTGNNIFSNEDGTDSDIFRWYIGGLQKHLPAAMPFIAPFTNSYNRFEAFMSAPTNVHWSRENRTVGLRVPESSPAARRVENRIAGSDVNPYLATAASLICGLIGIDKQIAPLDEFIGESYEDKERPLPKTLTEALVGFRESAALREYFGDALIDTFADTKQAEYENRSRVLSPWDLQYLLVNI
ncbi:MAG: glutamine synthetase [Alphaproteobacteria bacterium]|nr:MAG: glutamine synthetase [Alphaproteobacteria bacterium]